MKLSIITINYNDAKGLKATLESLEAQTYKEFEHIIIDGGSSDGSVPIIKSYEEHIAANRFNNKTQYPQMTWVSERDNGIYDAMNKGIAKASGEYLYFLNGGDTLVDEHVLEKLAMEIGKADIIVSKINFTDSSGVYHANHQPRMARLSLFYFLQKGVQHQSALIRRSLFEQCGMYDLQYKIAGDWDFFLRALVLHNATLYYTDLTLANFDGNGISSTHGKEMREEINHSFNQNIPERIGSDFMWMLRSGADVRRLMWIQYHPFAYWIFKTIVGVGRRFSK